jgi:hypothetical protein
MPKLIFTHYVYPSRITQKNELEYFDMNAMPRVIPMCPNMVEDLLPFAFHPRIKK